MKYGLIKVEIPKCCTECNFIRGNLQKTFYSVSEKQNEDDSTDFYDDS